jgi:hypothetical protein
MPLGERFGRIFGAHGDDPYEVMWRPAPQEQLRVAMGGVDLVVLDDKSNARLTDETRRWLAERGTVVERQERYVIYRIGR